VEGAQQFISNALWLAFHTGQHAAASTVPCNVVRVCNMLQCGVVCAAEHDQFAKCFAYAKQLLMTAF